MAAKTRGPANARRDTTAADGSFAAKLWQTAEALRNHKDAAPDYSAC